MKNKIFKKFICILLILSLFVISGKNTYAATYNLNITKYSQENTNWCWVACAKMIGNYYGRNLAQSSICTYVKGSAVNEAASLSEVTSAIKYASNKTILQGGTTAFLGFAMDLKANKPRVLRIGWNSGGGHVYVVSGVQEQEGPKLNALYLIDPIAGRASGLFSYANLINGTTLASGTGTYTHTWSVY